MDAVHTNRRVFNGRQSIPVDLRPKKPPVKGALVGTGILGRQFKHGKIYWVLVIADYGNNCIVFHFRGQVTV
jgi:hypothetical protein